MDIVLVALHALFFAPILVRLSGRSDGGRTHAARFLAEIAASARHPALILHAGGLLFLWAGVALALVDGRVSRAVSLRGAVGGFLLLCAVFLMTWSLAVLRSWRLLPVVDSGHQLCTTGPYGLVRHPMYLAIDLLGLGSAAWVGTLPVLLAAGLLVLGGDLRARREEKVLIEVFGDRYRDYVRRVRRTVPLLY